MPTGLKLSGWVSGLSAALFGFVGYALPADEHPALKTAALIAAGLCAVTLVVLLVLAFVRYRKRRTVATEESPVPKRVGIRNPGGQTTLRGRSRIKNQDTAIDAPAGKVTLEDDSDIS